MAQYGVWLVGAAGHVATCTVAGWAALRRGEVEPVGMITAAAPLDWLPLAGLDEAVFGGHETRTRPVAETARELVEERVLPAALIAAVADDLAAYQREVRPGIDGELGGAADFARVRADLAAFRDRHRLERVIVLHLASTEAPLEAALSDDPDGLLAAIRADLRLPPSLLYAAAALDLGMGFVNFTPSTGSAPTALGRLAEARGAVHAGCDGKTGETLVKTVLAPMFAIRQLAVRSWFSQNILGNNDGRALADGRRRASKLQSKGAVVEKILGYAPEGHVGIDYVPSYGDWKVAWDRIVFAGFGGAEMTLEFTWRGSDTALAAPLCIDLVRLVELAQRRGERGLLRHLGLFFKSPLGSDEHRLERQHRALLDHLLGPTRDA